jgi:hypothetical protein
MEKTIAFSGTGAPKTGQWWKFLINGDIYLLQKKWLHKGAILFPASTNVLILGFNQKGIGFYNHSTSDETGLGPTAIASFIIISFLVLLVGFDCFAFSCNSLIRLSLSLFCSSFFLFSASISF